MKRFGEESSGYEFATSLTEENRGRTRDGLFGGVLSTEN